MSTFSIAHYFPFCRVKIMGQSVSKEADLAVIYASPDLRYCPVCYVCGEKSSRRQKWERRQVRDLNFGPAKVWINYSFRKVYCRNCKGVRVEGLEFVYPGKRVTKRFGRYIYGLCKELPIKIVADRLGLDRKTVTKIDKFFLEEEYGKTNYDDLKILAVDEIAIKKGHKYMTVVLDYLSGRIVWMGKGRKKETLEEFFNGMTPEQKANIEAVAMDMWPAFITAVQENLPNAKIVFDLFHVVASFNKVIDKVRLSEYSKASKQDKSVYKGTKYLLLKNKQNIRRKKIAIA